jgi:hypothetical protein
MFRPVVFGIQQQANWFSIGLTTKTAFAYDFG